jgi:hypothetical protein
MIIVTVVRLIFVALMARTIFGAANIFGQDLARLGIDHTGLGSALITIVAIILICAPNLICDLVGGLVGYCIRICRGLGWRQLARSDSKACDSQCCDTNAKGDADRG